MRRPSVLFINRVYPPARGASGRVLRELARSFAREGWTVTVLCAGPQKREDKDGAVRVARIAGRRKPESALSYATLWIRLLFAALRLPRADLVVTLSDPPMLMIAGQIVKKIKGGRHMHWCQDLYPDLLPALDVKLPRWVLNRLKKIARGSLNGSDKVVAVGRCMARVLTSQGIDPKRISFIPNWPDFELARAPKTNGDTPPEDYMPANGEALNGAKPYEIQIKDGPKFRVMYAGSIGRAHPVDPILEAAEMLDQPHPEIEFVFIGDGPRFDYIARERARRGLNNIRLMPYQPAGRLRDLLESGDIHLISMREEAAGLLAPCKLYSALAVGRPCLYLGPDGTETAQVIEDYHAGSVLRPGDAQGLAEAIRRFRLNPDAWFAAHEGALAAAKVFVPKEAIEAWMQRAWSVVEDDVKRESAAA